MAKQPSRLPRQQEYRDNLAHDLKNLRNRYGETGKDLAKTLLSDQKYTDRYIRSIGKERVLDKNFAMDLIEHKQSGTLALCIEDNYNFKGLDKEIAVKLIEDGCGWVVMKHPSHFEGLTLNEEIAEKLINSKYAYENRTQGDMIPYDLEKFEDLDYEKVAMKIIEQGGGFAVVKNLDKFGLNHVDIANKLIDSNQGMLVLYNWKTFKGLKKQVIMDKMFERGDGGFIVGARSKINPNSDLYVTLDDATKENLMSFFDGLVFDQNLAERLINTPSKTCNTCACLVENLEYFEGLDYKKIALQLIDKGYAYEVSGKIEKFKNLDKEVDTKLCNAGYNSHRRRPKLFKKVFGYEWKI